jgi:hypothetical protein
VRGIGWQHRRGEAGQDSSGRNTIVCWVSTLPTAPVLPGYGSASRLLAMRPI